jgi:hypothetical protein
MLLNLVADRIVKGRLYPALAQHEARPYTQAWREFGQHYPYTIPLRLPEYCDYHKVKLGIFGIDDAFPDDSFYPVGLAFFNFEIDYFDLLPGTVIQLIKRQQLRVLFYYHEGDNPVCIKQRLDCLANKHQLPERCYVFVSANSAADTIPGFVYFADFELWYYQRNIGSPALKIHSDIRNKEFTALNRLHKSWRATAMADLKRNTVLENSYWSYCESGELDSDNPIEVDSIPELRTATDQFLKHAPYVSDDLDQSQRNNHALLESKYYVNSYCNIVLETHFDADQSGGTFLTEKTFKPIKHGQMFFVAGPVGSLAALRELGYRTFDSVLDTTYDTVIDNTQRWLSLKKSITQARSGISDHFKKAQADIEHNQHLFVSHKSQRLNTVIGKIHEQPR